MVFCLWEPKCGIPNALAPHSAYTLNGRKEEGGKNEAAFRHTSIYFFSFYNMEVQHCRTNK